MEDNICTAALRRDPEMGLSLGSVPHAGSLFICDTTGRFGCFLTRHRLPRRLFRSEDRALTNTAGETHLFCHLGLGYDSKPGILAHDLTYLCTSCLPVQFHRFQSFDLIPDHSANRYPRIKILCFQVVSSGTGRHVFPAKLRWIT
jgi:hypothetical protein